MEDASCYIGVARKSVSPPSRFVWPSFALSYRGSSSREEGGTSLRFSGWTVRGLNDPVVTGVVADVLLKNQIGVARD